MNHELIQHMLTASGRMALFIGAAILILVTVREWVAPKIAAAQKAEMLASFNEILPPGSYDNDLLHDTRTLPARPELGFTKPITFYRARKQGKPVAVLFETIAPDGYSGEIRLLVGLDYQGKILSVRVLEHRETPGLGDKIEKTKSDWVDSFSGKTITPKTEPLWKVKKDGGMFDQFTGATITPRAVVKAVKKAVRFYQRHKQEIWQ